MDHQFHRLAILIAEKQICACLLKPNLYGVAPIPVRMLELDELETGIVVKQVDRTIEHVAILHILRHGQCERVQKRQVMQRR